MRWQGNCILKNCSYRQMLSFRNTPKSIDSFCGPDACVCFFSLLIWISSFTTIRHLTVFSKNLMKAIKSIIVGDEYANTQEEKTEESYLYGNVCTSLSLREFLIKRVALFKVVVQCWFDYYKMMQWLSVEGNFFTTNISGFYGLSQHTMWFEMFHSSLSFARCFILIICKLNRYMQVTSMQADKSHFSF